jgi:hypothetical protein
VSAKRTIERCGELVDQGWHGVAVGKVGGKAGRVDSCSLEFRDFRVEPLRWSCIDRQRFSNYLRSGWAQSLCDPLAGAW